MVRQPRHITTLFRFGRVAFRFNAKAVLDKHAITHFVGSMALCVALTYGAARLGMNRPELWGAGVALALGILWEIGDGFKPLWTESPFGDWRDQMLRADGFSWSDVAIDIWGVVLGLVLLQTCFGF
ncbi:MAG: hypothetical protein Q8O14_14445 [bacterium]|nr:hypothetical protein [bacterium]